SASPISCRNRMRHVALFCSAVLCASCATHPHVYDPPDQTKVLESTRRVKEGIKKSRDAATDAKKFVEESQKSADKIATFSLSLSGKLNDMLKIAPPEMLPILNAAKTDATNIETEEANLKT